MSRKKRKEKKHLSIALISDYQKLVVTLQVFYTITMLKDVNICGILRVIKLINSEVIRRWPIGGVAKPLPWPKGMAQSPTQFYFLPFWMVELFPWLFGWFDHPPCSPPLPHFFKIFKLFFGHWGVAELNHPKWSWGGLATPHLGKRDGSINFFFSFFYFFLFSLEIYLWKFQTT